MGALPANTFECHLYISGRGQMSFRLPAESGPTRIARLQPLDYEQLFDPRFRRLLAAFESAGSQPLKTVQV